MNVKRVQIPAMPSTPKTHAMLCLIGNFPMPMWLSRELLSEAMLDEVEAFEAASKDFDAITKSIHAVWTTCFDVAYAARLRAIQHQDRTVFIRLGAVDPSIRPIVRRVFNEQFGITASDNDDIAVGVF